MLMNLIATMMWSATLLVAALLPALATSCVCAVFVCAIIHERDSRSNNNNK